MPAAPSASVSPAAALTPGATYKFIVRSAEEAVQTIRERLGENAKVLSVRQVPGQGLSGLFTKPKLEVIAQVAEAAPAPVASTYPQDRDKPADEAYAEFLPETSSVSANSSLSPTDELRLSSRAHSVSTASPRAVTPTARAHRDAPTRLPELLRRSGFSEAMLGRLQTLPAFAGHEDRPLHHTLSEVGQALRKMVLAKKPKPLPARTAFIGTPGVGRTTALCKWLAREIFSQQRTGRVLKAEFDKPNPAEGLAVFCEALGLSLEYYAPESDATDQGGLVTADSGEGFLYADLPGLSLREPADNAALATFLQRERFAGRVLVLNAAYDTAMLRRAYAAGRDLGATHLVFTHLDELEHWGKLWDFLLDGELTPLFLATGPSLTGDCEQDALGAVLRKTLPGA